MTATAYAVGTAVINRLVGGTATTMGSTGDDNRITSICGSVNAYMDTYIGRSIAADGTATYTFDGYSAYDNGKGLYVSNGIRTISSMTVATITGGSPVTVNTADYHVSPRIQDRRTNDWPGFEIRLHDIVVGTVPIFWPGYGNIVVTGDFGWAAIPADLTDVAEQIAVRIWYARQNGQADLAGTTDFGLAVISRYVSPEDKGRMRIYREDPVGVG